MHCKQSQCRPIYVTHRGDCIIPAAPLAAASRVKRGAVWDGNMQVYHAPPPTLRVNYYKVIYQHSQILSIIFFLFALTISGHLFFSAQAVRIHTHPYRSSGGGTVVALYSYEVISDVEQQRAQL